MFVLGYSEESNQFMIAKTGGLDPEFVQVGENQSPSYLHMLTISCRDHGCHNMKTVREILESIKNGFICIEGLQ